MPTDWENTTIQECIEGRAVKVHCNLILFWIKGSQKKTGFIRVNWPTSWKKRDLGLERWFLRLIYRKFSFNRGQICHKNSDLKKDPTHPHLVQLYQINRFCYGFPKRTVQAHSLLLLLQINHPALALPLRALLVYAAGSGRRQLPSALWEGQELTELEVYQC